MRELLIAVGPVGEACVELQVQARGRHLTPSCTGEHSGTAAQAVEVCRTQRLTLPTDGDRGAKGLPGAPQHRSVWRAQAEAAEQVCTLAPTPHFSDPKKSSSSSLTRS